MNISDEKLSAFLDSELSESEMNQVRDAIAQDDSLASRLAELSMVDDVVAKTYQAIDEQILPESVQATLEKDDAHPKSNVIELSLWRRVSHRVQEHAIAATVAAVVIGFGAGHYSSLNSSSDSEWPQVATLLNTEASGQIIELNDRSELAIQTSFKNQQGQWCRYFQQVDADVQANNVACKVNGKWEIKAQLFVEPLGGYQTASGQDATRQVIDSMVAGELLNKSEEQAAIASNWRSKP